MKNLIGHFEAGVEMKTINILGALATLKNVSANTISNCFRKAGFVRETIRGSENSSQEDSRNRAENSNSHGDSSKGEADTTMLDPLLERLCRE